MSFQNTFVALIYEEEIFDKYVKSCLDIVKKWIETLKFNSYNDPVSLLGEKTEFVGFLVRLRCTVLMLIPVEI